MKGSATPSAARPDTATPARALASFRFYEELNDFLPRERLTLAYLQNFYRGVGQTECLQRAAGDSTPTASPWRIGKTRFQQACHHLAFAGLSLVPQTQGKTWARALIRANVTRGRLSAWRAA